MYTTQRHFETQNPSTAIRVLSQTRHYTGVGMALQVKRQQSYKPDELPTHFKPLDAPSGVSTFQPLVEEEHITTLPHPVERDHELLL
jgi:hypothetical protein